ncbi:MAG: type I 3-dehydroquinate dehydratase [Gammaproteobacteria bacterium]|nr:type I 3-dehydroquinate dehydratase [Gammaproteobacteria bacterium]
MNLTKPLEARGRVIGEGREPLICTPLVASTRQALALELAEVQSLRPDLIEWRADFFERIADTAEVLDLARQLRSDAGDIPLLFTVRSHREGGQHIPLDDGEVASLYEAVCKSRAVDFVDFEMSAPAAQIALVRAACRGSGTRLVLSFHDFQSTPTAGELFAKFRHAQDLGGDAAKVAVMPATPEDVLTLLAATQKASRELGIPLISISMGAHGALSRVAGWMFGSSVTFAAGQGVSAPGQVPVEDLRAVLAVLQGALASK